MPPTKDPELERYEGRSLLLVLENYVLAAIGALSPEKSRAMTRVVQRVFGGGDDWRSTLRQRLQFTEALDEEVRTLWEKNRAVARQSGVELQPLQFARMIADENFASLFEQAEE